MNAAPCVLLPVYNAARSLEGAVSEMLDVLPDLSHRFQVCLFDDGSTDDTPEAAYEAAARYPQVQVLRHPTRRGLAATIETALDRTSWDVMMLGGELYSFDPDDLRTLWQLRELEHSTGKQTASYWSVACATWSKKWSRMRAGHERGLQVIRRQTFTEFRLRRAAEAVHRIDPGNAARVAAGAARPNFIGKLLRAPRQAKPGPSAAP